MARNKQEPARPIGRPLRRRHARLAGLLVLASTACDTAAVRPRASRTDRPNIVLLLADDLGHGDVSYAGGDVSTPFIDSLARGGVRMTAGYVTAPVCNPSRAALLTGRYQQRWGQELNRQSVPPVGAPLGGLPTSQETLAERLRAAGYATAVIGKWQMGMDEARHPLARGFDYFFGHSTRIDHVDPAWPDVHSVPASELGESGDLYRNHERVELDGYLTQEHAREAIEFIERHQDEPFFLYLAFFTPHSPLQVTQEYYDRHPERAHESRVYAGMIAALDDAVGAVMAKLEECGLDENTLVFFLSDNGAAHQADFDGPRNRPFSGHKGTLYEGGLRVPYVVRWTGRLEPGTLFEHPVRSLDVSRTALEAAGVPAADLELDGADLLPHLAGEQGEPPHEMLFWRSGPNAAVRRGRWKLLRTGDGRARLFDLFEDAGELRDLAREHPAVVRTMLHALEAWEAEVEPPRLGKRTWETAHGGDSIEWHL